MTQLIPTLKIFHYFRHYWKIRQCVPYHKISYF